MTVRTLACLTLALAVLASSVMAQDEGREQRGGRGRGGQQGGAGGPGGPFGRGGFGGFGGFGMNRSAGGAGSILNMLAIAEVRKEVGVTDEAYEPVGKMINEHREKQRDMRDATEEERKKVSDEFNTKAEDVMDELLAPAKLKRLKGIYAQLSQSRAVINTVIAKEIGVSESLRSEIEKALQEQMEKMFTNFQRGGGFGGGGGGAGMREAFTKAQEDAAKLVESKLSAEQKKALEELKGDKFELPQGGFGFGGGQGGFGGGNRGGGDRGGQGGGRTRGDGN